jgi:hypothetical protein
MAIDQGGGSIAVTAGGAAFAITLNAMDIHDQLGSIRGRGLDVYRHTSKPFASLESGRGMDTAVNTNSRNISL